MCLEEGGGRREGGGREEGGEREGRGGGGGSGGQKREKWEVEMDRSSTEGREVLHVYICTFCT